MLGRNHAAVGVASFAGAAWAGTHLLHLGALDAHQAVAGTVVAIGAALAPDLDESHSTAGRSNPISHLPIFGGHRRRTHCIAAVAAVTVAALACATNIDATAVAAGVAACTGGAELSRRLRHAGAVLCVPFGALFGYATDRWVHPGWWLIAAVAVPYFSHLLGDTLTPGGVPWLLPATQRWSIPLFRTGQTFERTILSPLLAATAAVAVWVVLSPPVTADLHTLLHAHPIASTSTSARPMPRAHCVPHQATRPCSASAATTST